MPIGGSFRLCAPWVRSTGSKAPDVVGAFAEQAGRLPHPALDGGSRPIAFAVFRALASAQ